MPDTSEITTYRQLLGEKYAEFDHLLAGLPAEALMWKPFAVSPWQGEAASLGWLVAHAVSSTVYLLRRAAWVMGRIEWDEVDGDEGAEEFGPANHDPAYLAARVTRTQRYADQMLAALTAADLDQSRSHPIQTDRILTARYDIQHAIEHMSQHIGHAQLTRQLWANENSNSE